MKKGCMSAKSVMKHEKKEMMTSKKAESGDKAMLRMAKKAVKKK